MRKEEKQRGSGRTETAGNQKRKEEHKLLVGGVRRIWHPQSNGDCSCSGNHIKAPESVNPNELQRSSRLGTLSPVTVLFQPIDLFSQ